MSSTGSNNAIDGKGRTVSEILSRKRYSIEYYQRKYRWGKNVPSGSDASKTSEPQGDLFATPEE